MEEKYFTESDSPLNYYLAYLKEKYDFEKYHFVELFIFFHDYISNDRQDSCEYSIDKQSFIEVTSSLFSILRKNNYQNSIINTISSEVEDEESDKKILKEIYKFLKVKNENDNNDILNHKPSKFISIGNLIKFLKFLTTTKLSKKNIFKILNKSEKSNINEDNINDLLLPIIDFINQNIENFPSVSSAYKINSQSLDKKRKNLIQILFDDEEGISYQDFDEDLLLFKLKRNSDLLNLFLFFFDISEEIINLLIERSPNVEKSVEEHENNSLAMINLMNVEMSSGESEDDDEQDPEQENSQYKNSNQINKEIELEENNHYINTKKNEEKVEVYLQKYENEDQNKEKDDEYYNQNQNGLHGQSIIQRDIYPTSSMSQSHLPTNYLDANYVPSIYLSNKRPSLKNYGESKENIILSNELKKLNSINSKKSRLSKDHDIESTPYEPRRISFAESKNSKRSKISKASERSLEKDIISPKSTRSARSRHNSKPASDEKLNCKSLINCVGKNTYQNSQYDNLNFPNNIKNSSNERSYQMEKIREEKIWKFNDCIDDNKLKSVEELKIHSCLYDISIYDFIEEIILLKNSNLLPEKLNKENFVNILLCIINRYTTPLKYFSKFKALEDIFILLFESRLTITQEEFIGSIISLCKGTHEEKIQLICEYLNLELFNNYSEETKQEEIVNISNYKKKIVLLLSGILNIGLERNPNEKSLNLDSKIIAENIFDFLYNKTKNYKYNLNFFMEEFKIWLSRDNPDKKVIFSKDHLDESKDSCHESTNTEQNKSFCTNNYKNCMHSNIESQYSHYSNIIISKLIELQNNMKIPEISPGLLVSIFKKYSLLGQINKSQFISSINEIFIHLDSHGILISETEKNNKISHILNIVNFDSKETDLIELIEILVPLILIFEVSVEEKINFIYQIFDERDELYLDDINYFLHRIFSFILKRNTFSNNKQISSLDDKLPIYLSKYLSEDIFNYFNLNTGTGNGVTYTPQSKKGISAKQLLEYIYNLY